MGCYRYHPSAEQFPIVVSQDCGHVETAKAISQYGDQVTHIKVGFCYIEINFVVYTFTSTELCYNKKL